MFPSIVTSILLLGLSGASAQDVWLQQATLSGNGADWKEGSLDLVRSPAVALDGDTLLFATGAIAEGLAVAGDATRACKGAVWVFRRSAGTWAVEAALVDPGAVGSTQVLHFGTGVGLDADTAIVGRVGSGGVGSAVVFGRTDRTWSYRQELVEDGVFSGYGSQPLVAGDTLLLVDPDSLSTSDPPGQDAYLYRRGPSGWRLTQQHTSDRAGVVLFGWPVAMSPTTAAIGWFGGLGSGGVDVFALDAGRMELEQRFARKSVTPGGIDVDDQTLVVVDQASQDSGEVEVYTRGPAGWTLQAAWAGGERWFVTAAVDGDRILIGTSDLTGLLYERVGDTWTFVQELVPEPPLGMFYLPTVALDGDTAVLAGTSELAVFARAAASCASGAGCATGHCVDGACCDSACGGGDPTDCVACSIAAGAVADGVCAPVADGTFCDDGEACTSADRCVVGACTGAAICDEELASECLPSCVDSAECPSLHTCTVDGTCVPEEGGCGCTMAPSPRVRSGFLVPVRRR